MLTLTFGNKWEESLETVERIRDTLSLGSTGIGLNHCPIDTMLLWHNRMQHLTEKNFHRFIKALGLPKALHHIWRLEFQVRGAPHAHILIWLENRIGLSKIKTVFSARVPPLFLPRLRAVVKSEFYHSCKPERCFSGREQGNCKNGFPKLTSSVTRYTNDGSIIYARGSSDRRIVEHAPALAFMWGAHCHIHILRTSEHPNTESKGIGYIVKYNMKIEPKLFVEASTDQINWETIFKARVVSAEEAAARILSFAFVVKDTAVSFVDTVPRNMRSALFNNDGNQIQMDDIKKYSMFN
jgi:hypothetical protein